MVTNQIQRGIQNPAKHLRRSVLRKWLMVLAVHYLCKALHFRYFTGFWIRSWNWLKILFWLLLTNGRCNFIRYRFPSRPMLKLFGASNCILQSSILYYLQLSRRKNHISLKQTWIYKNNVTWNHQALFNCGYAEVSH